MSWIPYSSAIGSLTYAMQCTCPDICYAVGLVSRYQANPGLAHWRAVKRILRDLRGTSDYMLCFRGADLRLRGYTDADWGSDPDERKSTSGYVFLLGGGDISWSSKKQKCVVLSTMESEYIACSATVQEVVWLWRFLESLNLVRHASEPVTVFTDSMSAIAYAKDKKYHGRMKHIDIRYHYLRDMTARKEVILTHLPTDQMVADPMTKPIARDRFRAHVSTMGLCRP